MNSFELRQKRAGLVAELRKAFEGVGDMTAEQRVKWDAMNADIDGLATQIADVERMESLDRELRDVATPEAKPEQVERNAAFARFLRSGIHGLSNAEVRALEVGTNSEGGYTVPDEFLRRIIEMGQEENVIRGLATVITSTSGTLKVPKESTNGSADWDDEEAAYNESDEVFDQVTFSAYKSTRLIKVSKELLADSAIDVEGYLATRFARSHAVLEESAYVNGNGTLKPTGVVQGSGAGVTAASDTAVTTDELIDLYHSLTRPYRRNARWLMADGTAKLLRKLVDDVGQYIWQPGITAGEPDMLLGKPVVISSAMPAVAAEAKPIVFGDFANYWIVDRQGFAIQRLVELYAANGQIGFVSDKRTDGKVVNANAFKHLVMAAASS